MAREFYPFGPAGDHEETVPELRDRVADLEETLHSWSKVISHLMADSDRLEYRVTPRMGVEWLASDKTDLQLLTIHMTDGSVEVRLLNPQQVAEFRQQQAIPLAVAMKGSMN